MRASFEARLLHDSVQKPSVEVFFPVIRNRDVVFEILVFENAVTSFLTVLDPSIFTKQLNQLLCFHASKVAYPQLTAKH